MTKLEGILKRAKQPAGTCMKLVLLWIALADDTLTQDEETVLERAFPHDPKDNESLVALRRIIEAGDLDGLSLACAVLRESLNPEGRLLALQLAVSIATADSRLSISENHILRFLADLLGCSPAGFSQVYQEITGADFPNPTDLSSADAWAAREAASRDRARETDEQARHSADGKRKKPRSADGMTRTRALAILGLEDGAKADDIRMAYRRLAQVHHPDRFGVTPVSWTVGGLGFQAACCRSLGVLWIVFILLSN